MKICIWTGHAFEPWGPTSIDEGGIGGSETAAIHMASELSKLGHHIVMWGEHQGREEVFNHGLLEYVDFRRALESPKYLACDVLVSSRDKSILRIKPDAKVKVLWIHDVHVGDDWEGEVDLFDRVYCLTKWHLEFVMEHYPHVAPEKFHLTRNGIDPARFEPGLPWKDLLARKTPSFVWSSSLDRGLDVMLDFWPDIKKMSPEASLHVYYGVENWRKLNTENKQGLAIIDYMMGRIERMTGDGVRYHGRVGQAELAKAHMGAIAWAYPTAWLETSCITALEAQAAGAFPVTSRLAALPETVREGVLVPGRNKSKLYKDEFLTELGRVLGDFKSQDDGTHDAFLTRAQDIARANRAWALEQTWASVARQWRRELEDLLASK